MQDLLHQIVGSKQTYRKFMDFVPLELWKLIFSLLSATCSNTQAVGSSLAILVATWPSFRNVENVYPSRRIARLR